MKSQKLPLAALAIVLPMFTYASPLPEPVPGLIDSVECLLVDVIVNILIGHRSATPFCSSILNIPTITKSVTSTVKKPTTTTIVTTGRTTTVQPVVTTYTTTVTTVSSCSATVENSKRGYYPPPPPPPPPYTPPNEGPTSTPTLPPYVTQYPFPDVSKACECLGIPTPTTTLVKTVTARPTVTATSSIVATATGKPTTTIETLTSTTTVNSCPAPTLCNNQGLEWAYYNSTSGDNDSKGWPAFVPESYKTNHAVRYQNVTSSIGGIRVRDGAPQSIYSPPPLASRYFVLNHRGYIYAKETGIYKFTFSNVDDIAYLWLGPDAYSGWTGANSAAKALYVTVPASSTYTTSLNEGEYYPVRILFGQAQGNAIFELTVTAPDGKEFLSSTSQASPYLVRYSCDGKTAPKYAPFRAET